MGIVPKFGKGKVANQVLSFQENLYRAVEFMLKYIGEDLAKYAKDNHTYTDQSGNLTNSISYAVVRNKELVYFSGSGASGEGTNASLALAMQLAANLDKTYTLIVLAGMNYAAYVEAKGYNVILPAELKARKEFPAHIARLKVMAKKKANELFGNVI